MASTKRVLVRLFLVLLVLGLLGPALAQSQAPRGASPPETVTIRNDGDPGSVLTISSIALDDPTHFSLVAGGSCPTPPFTLDSGVSCEQLVVFDPQALGPLSTTLRVISDAPTIVNDTVALSGNGTPGPQAELTIAPDPMDFGLVAAADLPRTDSFTVSNSGDPGTSLLINGLVLSGAGQFTIVAESCTGATLNQGDACTVTIEFDSAVDGMFSGQLEVQSSIGSATAAIQGSTQIPARLAFVAQPGDVGVNQTIAPPVVVEVQDSAGARVSLDNSTVVQIALGNDPSGTASLAGTVSATVNAGQASFSDLSIDQVGSAFTLTAGDSLAALAGDTSLAFDVLPGAPAGLEILTQPSDATVGQAIAPPVSVRVVDAFGFTVTTDNSTDIALALSGGAPGAVLAGGSPRTVTGGIASFAGLSVDRVGTAYRLTPAGEPGGLGGASSVVFDITPIASATTIVSVNPAGSQIVGQPYSVTVQVAGFNPTGTVAVTDGSGASCDIVLPATSCSLTSTTAGPKTLTANYPGDGNNGASNDIESYSITRATATVTIDSIDPAAHQAVNSPYAVNVSVAGAFSPTGVITVDDGNGASCLIVLPATSCDLTSTSIGPRTVTATYPGDANNLGDDDTAAYEIVPGAPDRLVFRVQPTSTSSGLALAPTVEVEVQDAFGNSVPADNASSVTLGLIGGAPGAALSGGGPVTVASGVASFPALSVDLAATGYRLQASAPGLTSTTSESFDIGPGAPVALRFDVPPSNTLVAATMTPAVAVSVRDAAGNLVDSATTTLVELSLSGGTPGALLTGGGPAAVSAGVATFGALAVDSTGSGYQLTASRVGGGLSEATSSSFSITESASSTSIVSISPAGSQTVGQPYEVVVDVAGAAPTGLVSVDDGQGANCTFSWPSQDRCALTSSSAGAITVTAAYAGDDDNASSSDSAAYTIDQAASSISITGVSPPAAQTVGQAYTVGVAVTGFNPTGTVEVSDGAGAACQIILPQTSCALTSTTVGARTLSADYPGDSNNGSSSDSIPYAIVAVASTTSILGITPPDEQAIGEAYAVTVAVSGDSPTGTVTVEDGAGAQCSFDLPASGCDLSSSVAGPKTITASYPGDAIHDPSSDTAAYNIIDSGPAALQFALEPVIGIAGGPLLPGLVVQVVNAQGQVVTDDNSTVIEIAILANPAGGTLSGTTARQVSNGVADFSDLSIDRVGEGYQLEASILSRGLSAIVTAPFDVETDRVFGDRFEEPVDEVFQDRFEWP